MPLLTKRTFAILWPWIAFLVFVLDVLLLFVARPFHRAVFEGELGLIELPTFLLLFATAPVAAWGAVRSRGSTRVLFVLLAVGCLYWGGEEVSWGQSFFHWSTPEGWSRGNYQEETNLHNERGIVGTLLNQTPRLILLILCFLSVAMKVPRLGGVRPWLAKKFPSDWVDRLALCWAPAALAVAASLISKFRPLGYKDFGETQELFTAILLLQFTLLQLRAARTEAPLARR